MAGQFFRDQGISPDLMHNLKVLSTAICEQVGQIACRLSGR